MLRSRETRKKILLIFLVVILGLFVLWKIGNEGMLQVWRGVERSFIEQDYAKNTSPLSIDVQIDLCQKFSIRSDDPKCKKGSKVYTFEFYSAISDYFYRLPEDQRRIEIVLEKIGKYQFKKEERVQDNLRYFFYWYDFTGDGKYPLVIQFEESGKIRRINTGVGRDSG